MPPRKQQYEENLPVLEEPLPPLMPESVDIPGADSRFYQDLYDDMGNQGAPQEVVDDVSAMPSEEEQPMDEIPETGMRFDFGSLRVQTKEDFAALPEEQKELLRAMKRGVQFTEESAAKFVLQQRERQQRLADEAAKIQSQSGKPMTSTEVKSLSDLDSVSFTLDAIESKLNSINQRGPIVGRVRQMSPYDTDAREVENLVTSIVPGLARGVFGEVGVLTDQDIKRYRDLIPNMTTSPEVAQRNITNLRQKISNSRKEKLETMKQAGFDVSGFEQQSQPAAAAPAAPKFEVGKPYRDNKGRVGIYKGNDANGRPIFDPSK